MAHSVGEQAARAVKNSERKKILETRTPDEIIKGIRGNLAAHLAVTPSDTALLLAQYDLRVSLIGDMLAEDRQRQAETVALQSKLIAAVEQIETLQAQVDRFREVYEQENRSTTVTFEQVQDETIVELPAQVYDALTSLVDHEHGGEA